ncbi:MAG: TIGR00300 family protein, partial [Armatimonadetes bacterium]|nr:TIGR00300 family protein [Armatimonadota bacterium]
RGGTFELEELEIGRRRTDPSRARIRVEAADPDLLEEILTRIQEHGAELLDAGDAELEAAPADGVFPDRFYVTSNHPGLVRVQGRWTPIEPVRMDCGVVIGPDGTARAVRFPQVRQGDRVVVGHRGVRVRPVQRDVRRAHHFEFMASEVSAEKPKGVVIRTIAAAMREARDGGQRILLVAGPAVVHTGAIPHIVRLIELGYVQVLFSGNALAVHDIEQAWYGTSLGIDAEHGRPVEAGHQHHLHAINRVRRLGGVRAAVETGALASGLMHACIRHGVEIVLAGSVRDDGPLPDVIVDVVAAQQEMGRHTQGIGFALIVATMLHGIAAGNLLPATCRIACVDINQAVVTKLADRGSFQALGLVTDVEPFFHELLAVLQTEG